MGTKPTPSEKRVEQPAPSWRDEMTPDELAEVQRANDYAELWRGMPTFDKRTLIDKLAKMLDARDQHPNS